MKIISLFVCLACCLNLKADLGSSLVYKARFFLKNGERQVGYFEIFSYGEEANTNNKYCNDKGVYEVVKKDLKNNNLDSLTIYKKIWFPKYFYWPRSKEELDADWVERFGAVNKEDVIKIAFKDISFTVYISSKVNSRNWQSEILITTQEVIDKLDSVKWFNHAEATQYVEVSELGGVQGNGFIFFNYNPKINEAEIIRLYKLKEKQLFQQEKENGQTYLRRLNEVKRWFWEKGIVIIAIHGSC